MPDRIRTLSASRIWFGGPAFLADLTGSIVGDVQVSHTAVVDRRRVVSDEADLIGVTADGISLDMTVTMALRASGETRKLLANPRGIWMLHRTDVPEVRMIPAICLAVPITSPDRGVIGYAARFAYDSTRFATVGAPVTAAGNVAVPAGGAGAQKTDAGIVYHEAAFAAVADGVAVGGPALVAEGARA